MNSIRRLFLTSTGRTLPFIVTGNTTKPGSVGIDQIQKRCPQCGKYRHILDFLVRTRVDRKGYQRIEGAEGEDHNKCHRHFDPVVIDLPESGKPLKLRIGGLRDDRGQPIDVWDSFDSCWRAMHTVGVRLMNRGASLRFQPRKNRRVGSDGKAYGKGKKGLRASPTE